MKVKKQQLEPDMQQLIGSKLVKEYDKAVYCHPVYLTSICLENPIDTGAWWAAVYGVIQSWTRLKRLSSSSSNSPQESMVLAQKWIYRPMEQDRKPRNIHAPMGTLFLTEEVRIFNGTKSAS